MYQDALDHLGQAAKLDPTLETAKERFENLRAFLKRCHESYAKKVKKFFRIDDSIVLHTTTILLRRN